LLHSPNKLFLTHLFNKQALLRKEKEALRKEKRAERAERVYLAEEETEKKIVERKENLARAVSSCEEL
jgi:hypothetical protein